MKKVRPKRLGDLVNLKRGYDLPESKRKEGSYPVISSAGISGYHSEYKKEGEGVVIGRYGTLGDAYYVEGRYWPHNTSLYVTDFKGNCPRYIYYLLACIGRIKTSDKSAVPGVNRNELHEMAVPAIDDVRLQKKIAHILATLDAKIDLNNRINAELEGMAKLLYDYWFVQFDFPITAAQAAAMGKPKLEGKPYRASGGKMIFNETLKREIPECWNHGTADSLFSFNPPVTLKEGTVAGFFDMDAVPTRGFMTKKVQYKAFSGGTKFTNGDVVVARITPCLENGKTALITQLEDGQVGFGSTEFIVMRGKSRTLNAFGACLARSDHFRKYAILNMTGTSGRKRIEASVLKTFPLAIPHVELLSNFEDICEPVFQKMTESEKQNQQLTELRDWLLPMLMNGQVTVG